VIFLGVDKFPEGLDRGHDRPEETPGTSGTKDFTPPKQPAPKVAFFMPGNPPHFVRIYGAGGVPSSPLGARVGYAEARLSERLARVCHLAYAKEDVSLLPPDVNSAAPPAALNALARP
jgi:hypothetical protein